MTGYPIYALRRSQCRFPVSPDSETKHLFCGEPVEAEGCVYCEPHALRAYDRRTLEQRRATHEKAAKARAAVGLASARPKY